MHLSSTSNGSFKISILLHFQNSVTAQVEERLFFLVHYSFSFMALLRVY